MPKLISVVCIAIVLTMLAVALLLETQTNYEPNGNGHSSHRYRTDTNRRPIASLLVGTGELMKLYITKDFLFSLLELLFILLDVTLHIMWALIINVAERF